MSPKLYYFFSGFSAYDYGTAGIAGNLNLRYSLQLYQRPTNVFSRSVWNNMPPPPVPANPNIVFNILQEDFSSLHLWQSLSRIVLITSIAVDKETILTIDDNGNPVNQEILTDFEIPQTTRTLKEYIFFFPQGELRRVNFKGSGPLSRFDLTVFYQDNQGNLVPLTIQPNFEFNIKIQFERRKARNLLYYINPDKYNKYFEKK